MTLKRYDTAYPNRSSSIDVGLAVMNEMRTDGTHCFSRDDIADICGCTKQAIARIEEQALRKLRRIPSLAKAFSEMR